MPSGTYMGHVHLRVSDVESTVAFCHDVLGFDLHEQLGSQAAFLAAGDYHHHLAVNVWESRGVGAAPPGSATLLHATIAFSDVVARDAAIDRVRAAGHPVEGELVEDPSGNRLALKV